jgi:predicted Fe-S protein YdhL (DUF1289 family)
MSAPLCLTWGYAREDDRCGDCGASVYPSSYVSVGRLDEGRLCEGCAEQTPFGLLADALDKLDDYVYWAQTDDQRRAAILNVQQAVRYMVSEEWPARYLGRVVA